MRLWKKGEVIYENIFRHLIFIQIVYKENDTQRILDLLKDNNVSQIFLSEITKIEFTSIVWRKFRMTEFTEFQAKESTILFSSNYVNYNFVLFDAAIAEHARVLVEKYGAHGLRTLDSIQLAVAISLKSQCQLFVTSDNLL